MNLIECILIKFMMDFNRFFLHDYYHTKYVFIFCLSASDSSSPKNAVSSLVSHSMYITSKALCPTVSLCTVSCVPLLKLLQKPPTETQVWRFATLDLEIQIEKRKTMSDTIRE